MDVSETALLIIDVQYDFLPPSGSLAVKDGDLILPFIYKLMENFKWSAIVLSQDFHPKGHISFASTHKQDEFKTIKVKVPYNNEIIDQVLWPDHCVQGTKGCDFEVGIKSRFETWSNLGKKSYVVQKGVHLQVDAYSAFTTHLNSQSTLQLTSPLTQFLQSNQIKQLLVVGLATDYCVKASVIDALNEGFQVFVLKEASAAVGGMEAKSEAESEMNQRGVNVISWSDL